MTVMLDGWQCTVSTDFGLTQHVHSIELRSTRVGYVVTLETYGGWEGIGSAGDARRVHTWLFSSPDWDDEAPRLLLHALAERGRVEDGEVPNRRPPRPYARGWTLSLRGDRILLRALDAPSHPLQGAFRVEGAELRRVPAGSPVRRPSG